MIDTATTHRRLIWIDVRVSSGLLRDSSLDEGRFFHALKESTMMITPRRQTPPDEWRFAHDSQALQDASMHSNNIPAKKPIRVIVSRTALLILSIFGASAFAAPANDFIENAQDVYLGFSESVNTSEAGTDDTDLNLNEYCGAPATDASVWYKYEATSDANVIIDVSQSTYSAGILVGVGAPDDLNWRTCGPSTIGFYAVEGETYYILAFDDQSDGGDNGGVLNISISEVLTPILVDFTVNRFGEFNPRTGAATISGTYTCANGSSFEVNSYATQSVGRFIISSDNKWFLEYDTCDQMPHLWSSVLEPISGKFGGGKAMTVNSTYACGWFECAYGYLDQKVQLRRGSRK